MLSGPGAVLPVLLRVSSSSKRVNGRLYGCGLFWSFRICSGVGGGLSEAMVW